MVDIANIFRPVKFARPVRTLAVTGVADGRRLQTLVITWDESGRLTRKESFDADGNSRVVTVRRYDEPGFVETERTVNARGEVLGHRRVTRSAGGELVSESWHAYPVNVFVIDQMQFKVGEAVRSLYRFVDDSRFVGAQLIDSEDQIAGVVSVLYDDSGRREHVLCDSGPIKGEVRYRYAPNEVMAELFLRGERAMTKQATFDAKGRVIVTLDSTEMIGPAARARYEYIDNAEGDWIRLDVFDLNSGQRGSSVECEIVYC